MTQAGDDVKLAANRELEEARYEASLAARQHEAVDPMKRLVARELESRWNSMTFIETLTRRGSSLWSAFSRLVL